MTDITVIKEKVKNGIPHGVIAEVTRRTGCAGSSVYALLKRYDGIIDERTLSEKELSMLVELAIILDVRNEKEQKLQELCPPQN